MKSKKRKIGPKEQQYRLSLENEDRQDEREIDTARKRGQKRPGNLLECRCERGKETSRSGDLPIPCHAQSRDVPRGNADHLVLPFGQHPILPVSGYWNLVHTEMPSLPLSIQHCCQACIGSLANAERHARPRTPPLSGESQGSMSGASEPSSTHGRNEGVVNMEDQPGGGGPPFRLAILTR